MSLGDAVTAPAGVACPQQSTAMDLGNSGHPCSPDCLGRLPLSLRPHPDALDLGQSILDTSQHLSLADTAAIIRVLNSATVPAGNIAELLGQSPGRWIWFIGVYIEMAHVQMSARPVEFKMHQTSTQLLKTSQRVSDAIDAGMAAFLKGLDVFRYGSLLQLCKSYGPRARVGSKPPQRLRRPRARHATGQRNPVSCGSDRSGLDPSRLLHRYYDAWPACRADSTPILLSSSRLQALPQHQQSVA